MADTSLTATANSSGIAVVSFAHNKSGLRWIVWQLTVETIPVRGGAQATIRRNGRYITSTIVGSGSSAQGPPALKMEPNDVLTCTWTGLTAGDEAILLFLYEEVPWGNAGSTFGLV